MKHVVYTALMGQYQALSVQPMAGVSDAVFICLTDDPGLTSDSWRVVLVEPAFPWDSVRSARMLKLLGHPVLDEFERSLWIDNRIILKSDPVDLIDELLMNNDIALPVHSYRDSVEDEFSAVLKSGFDRPEVVREQYDCLLGHAPSVLREVPYWTAIIARRRGSGVVQQAMRTWADQVLRHSRRDQLSVNYAFSATGLTPLAIEVDNVESPWHRWVSNQELPKRRDVVYSRQFKYSQARRALDFVRYGRPSQILSAAKRAVARRFRRR